VGNLHQFHDVLQRNRKFVPDKNCAACRDTKYLLGVKEGKYFVPDYKDVRLAPCPTPPKKSLLFKAINDEIGALPKGKQPNLGIKDHTQVDKDWLLVVLSTINQNHRYFKKDYYPTPEELREEVAQIPGLMVDNGDGFF